MAMTRCRRPAWLLAAAAIWLAGAAAAWAADVPLPPAVCPPVPPAAPDDAVKRADDALPYRPFPATWQDTLDQFSRDGKVPGAVIIVKSPAWGVRVGTTGVANLVTRVPVGPGEQFRVGSVSKAFLGQAILRLEQEGKLRLTDPLPTYLGDNKLVAGIPNIDKITVTDLLQMKSGIPNYLAAPSIGFSPQVTPQKHFDPGDLISVLSLAGRPGANAPQLPPDFAPGDTYPNPYWLTVLQKQPPTPVPAPYPDWEYSNSNYILLGLLAEKVTGLPIEQVLKRYVFDVVGLKDTYFATDATRLPVIHGYTKFGAIPYPDQVYDTWCDVTAVNPSYAWSAGAIVSTPWDLLKFEDAMFEDDKLLDEGTKAKWFTFVSADIHIGWEPMQYGVGGLMQSERSYGMARGHGGAFPGYKTLLYYFTDQKTSFVLASNTWDGEREVEMLDAIMPGVTSAVTMPQPGNAAAVRRDKSSTVRLSWQAGRVYGKTYIVFWGANATEVDRASETAHPGVKFVVVANVTAEVRVPPHATIYWRVDTVAPGQSLPLVIGPLWRFRTD
jgi:CubicO group peptidase (beta-lactamase class C family)